MLDALGFKGIWNRLRVEDLVQHLLELKAVATQDGDSLLGMAMPLDYDIRFFSDTIVIAASVPAQMEDLSKNESDIVTSAFALEAVCSLVQLTVARAAMSIPLSYRGSITVGSFEIAESFILGPAIDDAAEGERLAEGAFVWFLPEAMKCYEAAGEIHQKQGRVLAGNIERLTTTYIVPLKGGRLAETRVINPLANPGRLQRTEILTMRSRLISSFTRTDPAVEAKRTNTEAFLDHCLGVSTSRCQPNDSP